MEKKISSVGKNVKRIEENPVSKPFGCCSVLFTPHVENEITMQTSTQASLRQNPLSERFPNEMRSAKTNTLKDTQSESRHSKDLHDFHEWYRSHNWARYRRWHKHHWWKLQTQRLEIALQESKIKLTALNDDLPIMGECTVTIENKTREPEELLVVVQGKIDSLPLFGRPTSSSSFSSCNNKSRTC